MNDKRIAGTVADVVAFAGIILFGVGLHMLIGFAAALLWIASWLILIGFALAAKYGEVTGSNE